MNPGKFSVTCPSSTKDSPRPCLEGAWLVLLVCFEYFHRARVLHAGGITRVAEDCNVVPSLGDGRWKCLFFYFFIIKYPIRKDGVIRYEFPMHLLLIFIVHAFPFIGTAVIVRCAR